MNTYPCQTMNCGADCDQDVSVVYCFRCWEAAGKPRHTETGNSVAAINRVQIAALESQLAAMTARAEAAEAEANKVAANCSNEIAAMNEDAYRNTRQLREMEARAVSAEADARVLAELVKSLQDINLLRVNARCAEALARWSKP